MRKQASRNSPKVNSPKVSDQKFATKVSSTKNSCYIHIIWYITYLATHHEIPHSVNWWRKTLVNLVNHWWFAKCLHLNLTMSHDIKLIKKANKQEFTKVLLTKSFWWEICQSFPPTNICAIAMVYSLRWELVGDKYIALGKCYICHKTLTKSCMLSYKQI